jgi:hypothetical protein
MTFHRLVSPAGFSGVGLAACYACFFVPAPAPEVAIVELRQETLQAFDTYIQCAESRLDQQAKGGVFLWVDGSPPNRQLLQNGQLAAEPWTGSGDVEVPGGLIHDWVGAVFIPGATVARTLALVQDYDNHKRVYQPEVIDSRLVRRNGDDFKVYLRLLKKQILTVVLSTDHDVRYTRLDDARWYSRSRTTHIAEVSNPGTHGEHELPPGRDHGFLWRLNSYWRFVERDGGVYVECEAISLTRDVPLGLGWLINPIIRSLPRESLTGMLRNTRQAMVKK